MPSTTNTANTQTTQIEIPSQLLNDPLGYLELHQGIIISYLLDITFAIAILIIGWMAAKLISKFLHALMTKAKVEPTVTTFVSNIVKYIIIAFIVTAALAKVGIQTASFVAILGAASFAIGMSLQGSLSNFAAGVLLLLFRPIKIGEYIDAAGSSGTVKEITIFTTTLLTADNKTIIIPNNAISAGTIVNYSRMDKRRVDINFGVEYGSDLKAAKNALTKMFNSDSRIIKEDGITVVVSSLDASAIIISTRVWVKNADYWNVYFENTEKALDVLKEVGVNIPFNTVTVINTK